MLSTILVLFVQTHGSMEKSQSPLEVLHLHQNSQNSYQLLFFYSMIASAVSRGYSTFYLRGFTDYLEVTTTVMSFTYSASQPHFHLKVNHPEFMFVVSIVTRKAISFVTSLSFDPV